MQGLLICSPSPLLCSLLQQEISLSRCTTVSIAFIVGCMLGFCKTVMGWDLGMAETIAGVIVIGFSVDVVHFGHMYVHSPAKDRASRFIFAAERWAARS